MKVVISEEVPALNVRRLQDALGLFAERVRSLELADSSIVDPSVGQPLERLWLASGTHLQPGAVYEGRIPARVPRAEPLADGRVRFGAVTLATDDPLFATYMRRVQEGVAIPERTERYTIVADDARSAVVEYRSDIASATTSTITVSEPRRPTLMQFASTNDSGTSWWTRGRLTITGTGDLASAANVTQQDRRARVVAEGRSEHRRFQATGTVEVAPSAAGWGITCTIRARPRGVLRPASAIIGFFMRRFIAEEAPAIVDQLTAWIATVNNAAGAEELAERWFADALDKYRDASRPR